MKKCVGMLGLLALLASPLAQASAVVKFDSLSEMVRNLAIGFAGKNHQPFKLETGVISGIRQRDAYLIHLPSVGHGDELYKVAVILEETGSRASRVTVRLGVLDPRASELMHKYLSSQLVREIEDFSSAVNRSGPHRVTYLATRGYETEVRVDLTGLVESEAQDVMRTIDSALDAMVNEGSGVELLR